MTAIEQMLFCLLRIEKTLNAMEQRLAPEIVATRIEFYTIKHGRKERVTMKEFLKQGEQITLAIEPKDAKGNLAKVDGKPAWTQSDDTLGTLAVAEDGFSATFVPNGKAGALVINAKVDADLTEGEKIIAGECEVEVLPAEAVVVEMKATVEAIPVAAEEPAPEAPEVAPEA